jgi:hypothetical protein
MDRKRRTLQQANKIREIPTSKKNKKNYIFPLFVSSVRSVSVEHNKNVCDHSLWAT